MARLKLTVLTPEETLFEREADYVNLPTDFGSLGVLPMHAPMLCRLAPGVLRCRIGEETLRLRIGAGIARVEQNEVSVLVREAALSED